MSKKIPCQKCGHVWLWADWKREEDAVCPNGHGCALRGKAKMTDDIANQLRQRASKQLAATPVSLLNKAADRIEELEAKLAKAVEALEFWSQAQEPEIDAAINLMQTTLAELKGED